MSEYIMQCTTDMDGIDCYVHTGVLIRCKDCRYWEKYKSYATKGACKMWGETERSRNDYCSEGRQDEETD